MISVQALLVIVNSSLLVVAGYFVQEFVRSVRELGKEVASLTARVAVLEARVEVVSGA